MQSLMEELNQAVSFLTDKLKLGAKPQPQIGIVLGSGLTEFGEAVKNEAGSLCVPFKDIPHLPSSTVVGHRGELIYGQVMGKPVLIMSGRLHFYEGYNPQQVAMPIRILNRLGAQKLILTNASGAIRDEFEPGHLMVIKDHINLTGTSPLLGPNLHELGPRFVDMTEAYHPELRAIALKAAAASDIRMHEGVYLGLSGPCYETPAEVRMLKNLGADAVGMSTVFETIAARHLGMDVLGICCLTNKAAGLSKQLISHEEVMENNAKVASKFSMLLRTIINNFA